MTQLLQFAPATPMGPSSAYGTLDGTLDEAIAALSVFDADRLESMREQVQTLTTAYLTRELAAGRKALPDLLRKHTLLGEMLNATAANLKVAAAAFEAKRSRNRAALHDRSTPASWPR